MSTEVRILWLTFATVVLAALAFIVAFQTLTYMHRHDSETDTRGGWTEIHKAMVNLRVQRGFVLAQRGAMGAYGPGPNQFEERKSALSPGGVRDVSSMSGKRTKRPMVYSPR